MLFERLCANPKVEYGVDEIYMSIQRNLEMIFMENNVLDQYLFGVKGGPNQTNNAESIWQMHEYFSGKVARYEPRLYNTHISLDVVTECGARVMKVKVIGTIMGLEVDFETDISFEI